MPSVDKDFALHCLSAEKGCPTMTQRNEARAPSEACYGLSIRDTLFSFCVDAMVVVDINKDSTKEKRARKYENSLGQARAFAYSVAIIDNPYMPDWEAVLESAKKEARNR